MAVTQTAIECKVSALGGIRTHTERCLRPRSLPVGVLGRATLDYRVYFWSLTVGFTSSNKNLFPRNMGTEIGSWNSN